MALLRHYQSASTTRKFPCIPLRITQIPLESKVYAMLCLGSKGRASTLKQGSCQLRAGKVVIVLAGVPAQVKAGGDGALKIFCGP